MQLESYRSTSGPLEFRLPVFSTLVSTRHHKKSADSIRARARSGMALRRQHPRKGPCRRVQSGRRTSCTSHGTHQRRSKHQDACPSHAGSQALVIALSAGDDADISLAEELTACLPQDSTLIADKAY